VSAIRYAKPPPEPTPAQWRRIALAHLESAILGRCLVHPECASASSFGVGPADEGVECWRATVAAAWGDPVARWLMGVACPSCQQRVKERRRRYEMWCKGKKAYDSGYWEGRVPGVYGRGDDPTIPWLGESGGSYIPVTTYMRWADDTRGTTHHHCPRSRKDHETPAPWRSRLFAQRTLVVEAQNAEPPHPGG